MKQEHHYNGRDLTKRANKVYFGVKYGDQDFKTWATHKVWENRTDTFYFWTKEKVKAMKIVVPMVWWEPTNHHHDCYFCMVNMTSWKKHKKNMWYCPNIPSAKSAVLYCNEIPIPVFSSLPDLASVVILNQPTQESNIMAALLVTRDLLCQKQSHLLKVNLMTWVEI